MATLTLNLPDSFENSREEIVQFIAAKLYEARKVSLAQGAEMCNVRKRDFPAILSKFEVPYFQYTGDEFLNEFEKPSKE